MDINLQRDGGMLTIALTGRLDTITSPKLDDVLHAEIKGVDELVFDLGQLEYISSAGLRVLLAAQKIMNKQGTMVVKNVKPMIMEIFEVTGFDSILTIE